MEKTSPILTASTASMFYFIVFIMLKYSLQNEILDWQNALLGALVFGLFIFLIHHILYRAKQSYGREK